MQTSLNIALVVVGVALLIVLGLTAFYVIRDHIENKVWEDAWQDGYNAGKAENEPPF